jgi:hypothetical protein
VVASAPHGHRTFDLLTPVVWPWSPPSAWPGRPLGVSQLRQWGVRPGRRGRSGLCGCPTPGPLERRGHPGGAHLQKTAEGAAGRLLRPGRGHPGSSVTRRRGTEETFDFAPPAQGRPRRGAPGTGWLGGWSDACTRWAAAVAEHRLVCTRRPPPRACGTESAGWCPQHAASSAWPGKPCPAAPLFEGVALQRITATATWQHLDRAGEGLLLIDSRR